MKQNRRKLVVPAIVIGIVLLLIGWLACRNGDGQDRVAGDSLPGMVQPGGKYRLDLGPPDEWFAAGAKGETYTETLLGESFRAGTADAYLGHSSPNGPYMPRYVVGRAYPGWDTSALPDGVQVLSATLVLDLPIGGGREEPLEIAVYQGIWTPPIDLEDWQSPGSEAVGHWLLPASRIEERGVVRTDQDIILYAPEPARTMRISLDPAVVEMDGVTRLELRHAGEGTPPTTAGVVSLGPSQIRLEVEFQP